MIFIQWGFEVMTTPCRPVSSLHKHLVFPELLIVGWLFVPERAFGYLDQASGSMLIQLLLGGFAGMSVVARMLLDRLSLFRSPAGHAPARDAHKDADSPRRSPDQAIQ